MSYTNGVYDKSERKWFKLPAKAGGDDSALTFNETEQLRVVQRYYPRGPIHISKMGVLTVATLGKGEEVLAINVNGTRMEEITASTTSAPWTIASVAVDKTVNAGSYITLLASTNACSTGSVAVFIDYRPAYTYEEKWEK